MKTTCALLAVLFVSCASQAPRVVAVPGDLVIEEVTVVPMDRDGALSHQTVVVRGDRIIAVEPAAAVQIGNGVTRIPGAGKWLMPGLSDMHVHVWSEDELQMFVAAGVTTVRNMFGSELHLAWREQIARGELFGPTLVTAGPIVDGARAMWPTSVSLGKPADAAQVVTEHMAAGYDFAKVYGGVSRDTYVALAAAAKERGLPLAGHVPWDVGIETAMATGQRSVEHLDGWLDAAETPGAEHDFSNYWGEIARQLSRVESERLGPLVEKARVSQTWQCPTLIVMKRISQLDDVPALRSSVRWLDVISPATIKSWLPESDFRFDKLDPEKYKTMRDLNEFNARVVRELAAAGAPILAGTDQGNPFVVAGVALLDELELLVGAGLTRQQALATATTNAARYLGKEGEFGVVAPGARADLILLSSDPLAGPVPLPDGVILRGKWNPADSLRTRLDVIAASHTRVESFEVPAPVVADLVGAPHYEARYEMQAYGQLYGDVRVVAGKAASEELVVLREMLDDSVMTEVETQLESNQTQMVVKRPQGSFRLTLRREGEQVVGEGATFRGVPVKVTLPFPKNAFLSGGRVAASIALARALKSVPVGGSASFVGLAPVWTRNPDVEETKYEVSRKPDANGQKVYEVKATTGRFSASGELAVDAEGWPVSHSYGPPMEMVIRRK